MNLRAIKPPHNSYKPKPQKIIFTLSCNEFLLAPILLALPNYKIQNGMKNYKNLFLFTFLIFALSTSLISQHSILGDIEACYRECKTYNLDGGVGGPYYWQTTGDLEGTNQGSTVNICWNTIGSNTITLVDFSAPSTSQTEKIDITVASIPTPEIIPPLYPNCTIKDSIPLSGENELQIVECLTACSGSIGFYSFEENNGAATEWEVDGGTIVSNTLEGITIEWNLSGSGFIKLTETNTFGCVDSAFFCIEILEPLDVDILAFNGGANSINVCADQVVYLQALGSEETTSFEWSMGDGTFQYGTNITASYSQGGTYDIALIGSTECKCFDTSYYQIIVDSNPGPEITCIGTTCGNEDHTYYAANPCGTYNWNISSNGSISDGGGLTDNYVTVNWSNGPVGTVGLSTSGCSEAVCAIETVVQIPILDGTATIEGPIVACRGGATNYSIQYYNGTEYVWNVTGNGSIINGWGTNQITVQWDDDPFSDYNATISVSYENCYLECGGQASLPVVLKPDFDISLSELVCSGSQSYITGVEGWNAATLSWTITSPSGSVANYPNVSYFNETYTEIGVYQVSAIDNANTYCNHEVISFFEVVEAPQQPTSITGPLVICINEYYNYSAPLPSAGLSVIWNIYDGSNWNQIRGNTVTVQWTSTGPYELHVSYLRDDSNCRSDDLVVMLEAAQNATITGPSNTCVDGIETYSIGATNGNLPEWAVMPNDAGSIIHNPDNTIDVMWHLPGNHQITSDYCGAMLSYNVNVNPLGANSVDYLEEICPGDLTTITSTIPASSTIEIRDESNTVVGNSTSVNVPNGKYEVEITSIDGCVEIIPVVIDVFLPPTIRVSSPDENAFCLPHPNVSIVALDTKDGYTYEWFHDNISMGQTTSTISTNQYGDYHVQVTDKNGCTAISNIHTLYEWCFGDPPPGTCTGSNGHGLFDIGEFYLRCNSLQFSIIGFGYASTSFIWNFGDPDSGVNNTSTDASPIHEFTYAGYYYVYVRGDAPGEDGVDIFTVPAAPKFDYERACAGNDVQFRNHSTFIPGFDIINYTWDFGDPTSGSDNNSNDENPIHIFNTAGNYTVILEIESSTGCMSSYELEVIVEEGPFAEFILPTSACTDDGVYFEAFQDPNIYTYEWDFDDPSSGVSNTSKNPIAIHTFSGNGSYNVSLSVTDGDNCVQTISKPVDVTSTTLSGEITADQTFPICFGDEVILTAPAGGTDYFWSDGSIGQSITVSDPGVYHVTITENTGCDYVPDPINVVAEGIFEAKIRATHLESDFFGTSYFDSLEICQGELFYMTTTWVSLATYLWSNGNATSFVSEWELAGLAPGRHDFHVTLTDFFSGCEYESKPITIIVNALPSTIAISSSSANPCEGEEHILTVDNPDPDLIYYWNTGARGLTTTVNKGGYYSVTAINKNGCERESSSIYVAPLPNANRINLGCTEACFPDTICIPTITGAASYQWLLDGTPVPGPQGTTQDLIADQAGEYQLIVANYFGCSDTSDILSIEAEPSNQSVSGIVFIDSNNNGVWDVGEELLSGVPVNLYMGTVLQTTITTDIDGYYNFDPVSISNPRIVIDTAGLGLNLTGGILEDDIDFIHCLEDKEKNFPLIKECTTSSETVDLFTCSGETITVNSIVLQSGDTWTFTDTNSEGCDSMTLVMVSAFPQSDVNLTTDESCQDVDNGVLNITIMAGSGLQFAVDNNSTFTSNLQFDNLAPGTHMLWITDGNNCTQNYSFEIETLATPSMSIVPQNTCANLNTGQAEIIPVGTGNFEYSLDGMVFSPDNVFDNLGAGTYPVYVQEDNLCIYEYSFIIAPNPEPQFAFSPTPSCSTGASGSLEITPQTMGTFEYSLDNIIFTTSNIFDNLAVGTQTLFVQEIDGCTHIYSFDIPATLEPGVEFFNENTCEGEANGSISIVASLPEDLEEYEFSIDGVNFTNDIEFFNIPEGSHTLYLLEDGICEFQFPFDIVAQPAPSVVFDTEDACTGEANGAVNMNTSEIGLEYSIDQIDFTTSNTIQDLDAGIHTIYVKGENSCVHPFEVEIFEAGDLEVEFIEPALDCSVREANLVPIIIDSYGDISYAWDTGESDSTIVAANSGVYNLSVTDKCSTQEYSWDIQLEEVIREQPIYFPNIFSPNQDGVNECFVPMVRPETTILSYKLSIFDRWGNKYFETTEMDDCWDGIYNGKNVKTGVFVYLLEMDYTYCVEVEKLKKYGDVTIVY